MKTPQTNLTMNGVVSRHSSVNLHLQANDLREVDAIAEMFRTPAPGETLQPLGLAGAATFQGYVQELYGGTAFGGAAHGDESSVQGNGLEGVQGRGGWEPLAIERAKCRAGPLLPWTHITFKCERGGLSKWSFTENSPLQVQLNASQIDITDPDPVGGGNRFPSPVL